MDTSGDVSLKVDRRRASSVETRTLREEEQTPHWQTLSDPASLSPILKAGFDQWTHTQDGLSFRSKERILQCAAKKGRSISKDASLLTFHCSAPSLLEESRFAELSFWQPTGGSQGGGSQGGAPYGWDPSLWGQWDHPFFALNEEGYYGCNQVTPQHTCSQPVSCYPFLPVTYVDRRANYFALTLAPTPPTTSPTMSPTGTPTSPTATPTSHPTAAPTSPTFSPTGPPLKSPTASPGCPCERRRFFPIIPPRPCGCGSSWQPNPPAWSGYL